MDRIYRCPDGGSCRRCHRRVCRIGEAHGPPGTGDQLNDICTDETSQPIAVRIGFCIAVRIAGFDAVAVSHRGRFRRCQRFRDAQRIVVRAGAVITEPWRKSFR